jgi:hypothetical protein
VRFDIVDGSGDKVGELREDPAAGLVGCLSLAFVLFVGLPLAVVGMILIALDNVARNLDSAPRWLALLAGGVTIWVLLQAATGKALDMLHGRPLWWRRYAKGEARDPIPVWSRMAMWTVSLGSIPLIGVALMPIGQAAFRVTPATRPVLSYALNAASDWAKVVPVAVRINADGSVTIIERVRRIAAGLSESTFSVLGPAWCEDGGSASYWDQPGPGQMRYGLSSWALAGTAQVLHGCSSALPQGSDVVVELAFAKGSTGTGAALLPDSYQDGGFRFGSIKLGDAVADTGASSPTPSFDPLAVGMHQIGLVTHSPSGNVARLDGYAVDTAGRINVVETFTALVSDMEIGSGKLSGSSGDVIYATGWMNATKAFVPGGGGFVTLRQGHEDTLTTVFPASGVQAPLAFKDGYFADVPLDTPETGVGDLADSAGVGTPAAGASSAAPLPTPPPSGPNPVPGTYNFGLRDTTYDGGSIELVSIVVAKSGSMTANLIYRPTTNRQLCDRSAAIVEDSSAQYLDQAVGWRVGRTTLDLSACVSVQAGVDYTIAYRFPRLNDASYTFALRNVGADFLRLSVRSRP